MKKVKVCMLIAVTSLLISCAAAGLGSVEKLNQLDVGMAQSEVRTILGEPKSKTAGEGKTVLKYSLHEYYKGWVPYYFEFDAKDQLTAWYANEEEYQQNQDELTALFQPLLESQGTSQGGAAAPGPNDSQLQQHIAGYYYSYQGSTERKLMLCPNGSFRFATESSYSANQNMDGTTDWGAASTGQDGGNWTITGTMQQGTLTLNFSNGDTFNYDFKAGSDKGSFYFNNILFGYAGAPSCE